MINIDKNEEILGAIVSLEGNHDWEIIRRWMKDSLGQAFLDCTAAKQEIAMYAFNGGRANELKDLVNQIDKARKNLDANRGRR